MLNTLSPSSHRIDIFAGFGPIVRLFLKRWKNCVVEIEDREGTLGIIEDIKRRLQSENIIVFFDHHYAFDGLPALLALGDLAEVSQQVSGVLIPYAVYLDMGVNNEGRFSLRYWLRTLGFQRLVHGIRKANPNVLFFPIAREFELENPRLNAIANQLHPNSNVKYLKTFVNLFKLNRRGQVCLLAPMAGIAFPGKPVLHPKTYRSMEIVQSQAKQELPIYFIGAYPRLDAYTDYLAPLFLKHKFVLIGPFTLPAGDYQGAYNIVADKLDTMRRSAKFEPPDYSRMSAK